MTDKVHTLQSIRAQATELKANLITWRRLTDALTVENAILRAENKRLRAQLDARATSQEAHRG